MLHKNFFVRMVIVLATCLTSTAATAGVQDLDGMAARTVRISGDKGWAHGLRLDPTHILTAAHVVDEYSKGYEFEIKNPFGVKVGTAHVVRIGRRDSVDLALLELVPATNHYENIHDSVKVCTQNETPGAEIGVAFENMVQLTHASLEAGFVTYSKGASYSRATESFLSRGVSGAGVYSVTPYCLAGIISMSSEKSTGDISCLASTYGEKKEIVKACAAEVGTMFVPADEINKFLK